NLKPLYKNAKIRSINMDYNLLSEVNFRKETEWRNIEELRLFSNEIEKIDFKFLEKSKNLRELDLGDNKLRKIILDPLSEDNKLSAISLERNLLKDIDLSGMGEKKKYVLCTDPNVIIKSMTETKSQNKPTIVFSKGSFYSAEQEKMLDRFFKEEKRERKERRNALLRDIPSRIS
ncbi:MAG: leucine-rich repeat domain-containing protein, partial [Candidatus Heimdallarchaeota archaeon]|nr:leucine-rich repeat domain-containing protein [Candidatus Heimdallarchaeota archaeon]